MLEKWHVRMLPSQNIRELHDHQQGFSSWMSAMDDALPRSFAVSLTKHF